MCILWFLFDSFIFSIYLFYLILFTTNCFLISFIVFIFSIGHQKIEQKAKDNKKQSINTKKKEEKKSGETAQSKTKNIYN